MLTLDFRISYIFYPLYEDDVSKQDFDTLKSSFTELQEKHDEAMSEKSQLEEDLKKSPRS